MKVAILTDSFPPESEGGAAVIARNQAVELARAGHEVVVITTTQKTRKDESLQAHEGYSVFSVYSNYNPRFRAYKSLNNWRVVRKVNTILSKVKPDIVHAHNIHFHLSYASLRVARRHAKGVFLTVHDSMPFHYSKLFPETVGARDGNVENYKVSSWTQLRLFKTGFNPFRKGIIKKYLQIPYKIFAVSGALAQALSDNGIENVKVLHNGIDVKNWEGSGVAGVPKKVFFGGRLSAVKGGEVLVRAVRTIPTTKLLVVGEENEYAKKMREGAGDIIEFTGKQPHSEMKKFYADASVVAAPSLCFDWFPTVVLEAMASKRPVIATCFGGAKEMVAEGKTGFIINPAHEEELTEALTKILSNPKLALQMGEAGYKRVESEFSMRKHMEQLLGWYTKVL